MAPSRTLSARDAGTERTARSRFFSRACPSGLPCSTAAHPLAQMTRWPSTRSRTLTATQTTMLAVMDWLLRASKDVDFHVDVVACGLRVRAELVRGVGQLAGSGLIQPRQGHVQPSTQEELLVGGTEVDFGVDGCTGITSEARPRSQFAPALATSRPHPSASATRPACAACRSQRSAVGARHLETASSPDRPK